MYLDENIHFLSVCSESGTLHNKPAYNKENGTHGNAGSSSAAPGMVANNMNQHPPSQRLVLNRSDLSLGCSLWES